MRKVKLSMQTTINGFVGGVNGENDWMTWNPDDEFLAFLSSQYDSSDTILMGRKLADGGFINYWEGVAENNPEHAFAKKIVELPKIVFTNTLEESTWNNTTLAKGDLAEEITELKNQYGKDIIVFGGADFVSSLIKENLIDEYYFILNPTAMGKGMTIFGALDEIRKLEPVSAKLFSGGKIVLCYKPQNA